MRFALPRSTAGAIAVLADGYYSSLSLRKLCERLEGLEVTIEELDESHLEYTLWASLWKTFANTKVAMRL
jgi:hypothetical protein